MKLLMLILSVMTFTVQSKNAVSADGSWPYDMEASYANTYNKGQVRAGDVATLTVSGLGGITINQVEVYLKSNKSSGAGTFTLSANAQTLATQTGTFEEWTGAYDNTDFHAITLFTGEQKGVNELTISLTGTVNSLHIEKYVISWSNIAPRVVTLMKGASVFAQLTESEHGAGVILPAVSDTADWQFVGWSAQDIQSTHSMPTLYSAGRTFVPSEDCTLWATYRLRDKTEPQYASSLESGYYRYVNRQSNVALTGFPVNGQMQSVPVNTADEDQLYYIDFTDSDMAYITHAKTGEPVGYAGTQLAVAASPWKTFHDGEEIFFYALIDGKSYVLWLNILDESTMQYHAGLLQADIAGNSPMGLMTQPAEEEPLFTCHPERFLSIDNTSAPTRISYLQFGNYELRIVGGIKYLILR